jgi:hypothetical protein
MEIQLLEYKINSKKKNRPMLNIERIEKDFANLLFIQL